MNKLNKGGLNPLVKDERDLQLGALIKWPKLTELPSEFIIKPLSIKDQIADGNDDFCASCAGTGMVEPKEEVELFYPYLFAAAKYESGKDTDSWGLTMRDVGKGLTKWGIPETKDVPDHVKNLSQKGRRQFKNYPEEVRKVAMKHQAQSYFFLTGPYDHYDNARAAEWYFRGKKQHIMFGLLFGWLISDFRLDGKPSGFGHALWQGGWFHHGIRAVNSAGYEAGSDGIHTVSRETFNYYAEKFGLMMITDMPRDKAEYHCKNKIRIDQNWLIQLFVAFKNLFV